MSAFLFRILNMKKVPVYLFILIFLAGCKDTTKTKSGTPVDNWNLVWGDEFDKEGLPDSTKWSYNTGGHGWGNQELQFYTENRRENARIENGHLIIEAHKEPWEGAKYTSARMVSQGKGEWQYGRVEVKAKIPSGLGTWPAIWMLATNEPWHGRMMVNLTLWNMWGTTRGLYTVQFIVKNIITLLARKRRILSMCQTMLMHFTCIQQNGIRTAFA